MSLPMHRSGDTVDIYPHGDAGGRVCKVIAVENCHPFEHWVTVRERGSLRTWRLPEGDVSSPLNREVR